MFHRMKLLTLLVCLLLLQFKLNAAVVTTEEEILALNSLNDLTGVETTEIEQRQVKVDEVVEVDKVIGVDNVVNDDTEDNVDKLDEGNDYDNYDYTDYLANNVDNEFNRIRWPTYSPVSTRMNWTHYQPLKVIENWLVEQEEFFKFRRPNFVKLIKIGYSYEERPIYGLHIQWFQNRYRKAVLIESNIHAIEWISSAAGTCFIQKLLNRETWQLRRLLFYYDWIYIPVMNPDGFWYSKNVQRLWRKNRKPTGFSNETGICYGTDLNRNFDFKWNAAGYNIEVPCDHWYGGKSPASEPEVQSLVNYINSLPNGYVRAMFSIHAYGNLLLLPYGHTNETKPENYEQMMTLSKAFADAAAVKYGTQFKYGSSGDLLYPVSGSAKDWAYGVKKIPYTATLELRDTGKYGFLLPANQIQEVCEEITDGFVGFMLKAEQQRLFR